MRTENPHTHPVARMVAKTWREVVKADVSFVIPQCPVCGYDMALWKNVTPKIARAPVPDLLWKCVIADCSTVLPCTG